MTPTADWTFMVYIAGDNNLSGAGDNDLREMRRVGSSDRVNVVVEFDNAGQEGTRRFLIRKDGADERVETLGETDSGSPETLLAFIVWAAKEYPARRYALVLWNHGGGWEPTEMDRIARAAGAADFSQREAVERAATPLARVFFRSTLERVLTLPSSSERAICSDDGSGHSLDTIELDRVLARGAEAIGRPFDLLGMDACLMSNFEVAYQLRRHARYLVASEENEPAHGWPYDRVLAALAADPGLETGELARSIVDLYIRSYTERGYAGDLTQSAFDLSRVQEIADALDALAAALIADLPDAAGPIWAAQRKSARFRNNTLWDVAHFCERLRDLTQSAPVRTAADALLAVLRPGAERCLIAEAHSGAKVERCCGVSVYLLPPLTRISRYYRELAFAADSRWLELLEAYHAA